MTAAVPLGHRGWADRASPSGLRQGERQATSGTELSAAYAMLDEVLARPVFKRELFAAPLVIASVDLLRHGDSFLCRVRSKDGAEGGSVGNSAQLDVL